MTPPPGTAERLAEIREAITADAERAEALIVDLLDLADSSPDPESLLEFAAQALAAAMFKYMPVETIRTVRAWSKESDTPPPAPNPTVTQLGCTVDASEVAAAWAALLAKMPPKHGLDLAAAIAAAKPTDDEPPEGWEERAMERFRRETTRPPKPKHPWTEWDEYGRCWVCVHCGAAAMYAIHAPSCRVAQPEKETP